MVVQSRADKTMAFKVGLTIQWQFKVGLTIQW